MSQAAELACLSPHPKRRRPECMALLWWEPYNSGRVRVILWTCDCRGGFYELCEAAGVAFIRKTCRNGAVRESDTWLVREARKVWDALLGGHAR